MYDHRRYPRAPVRISLVMVLLAMASCTRGQRVDTIHTTLVAVTSARDGFTAWDRQHQLALVSAASTREEAEASVSSYHASRAIVIDGFEFAYRALAVAATQTDELSLRAAVGAADDLIAKVRAMMGGR